MKKKLITLKEKPVLMFFWKKVKKKSKLMKINKIVAKKFKKTHSKFEKTYFLLWIFPIFPLKLFVCQPVYIYFYYI